MFNKKKLDRLDYISKDYSAWSNAVGNVRMIPLRLFEPQTKEDILLILEDARKKGITVHPIGAGHSFSEAAKEDYYAIRPFALTACSDYTLALKNGALKEQRHLVKVQCGIRVKCLNKKLFNMGYALDNMGAFDWQSISGAISTGTHGTGIHRGAMQDQVRAIILILSNGETWHIEPAEGITDPALFNHNEGIKLVQNDDIFYSAVLSLGAMGFIYEFILEVGEKYWLEETRQVLNWDTDLKPAILDGRFQQWVEHDFEFVSFRVNPYYTKDKKTGEQVRLCSLAFQKVHSDKRVPHGEARNIFFTFLGNLGLSMWILIQRLNANLSRIPESINMAIKGTKDKNFVSRSYRVLYQSGLSIRREGISSEFAFDLDYNNLVNIIDKLGIHFSELRDQYGLYLSSHIPVRFVPKSKAYLSQCHTGPKMYVDLPTLDGVHGAEQILDHNQVYVLNELKGIIHWGKLNYHLYTRHDLISAHYPMANVWSTIRNQLDPIGMFHSYFAKKMGL